MRTSGSGGLHPAGPNPWFCR